MTATRMHEADAPDWAAIAIVILSVTAFAIAQGLTFPLISLVLQGRGMSGSMIGLNAAGYAVGAATAVLTIDNLPSAFAAIA